MKDEENQVAFISKIKYIIIFPSLWPVQFKDQPRKRCFFLFFFFLKVEGGSWPILHHLASEQLGFVAGPHALPALGNAHFSGLFWSGAVADYFSLPSPHPDAPLTYQGRDDPESFPR